jgi:hypothetical protein
MIEVNYLKSKVVYATIAVIFVTTTLVTLPYENQVANAQSTRRIQAVVTLTDVPANAEALEVNATLNRDRDLLQETTVSSPSEGNTVEFVFRVEPRTNIIDFIVCANLESDEDIFNCEQVFFNGKVRGPIRVGLEYPTSSGGG